MVHCLNWNTQKVTRRSTCNYAGTTGTKARLQKDQLRYKVVLNNDPFHTITPSTRPRGFGMPGVYKRRAWLPLGQSKGQTVQTLPDSPTISGKQCICNVWLYYGNRRNLMQCPTHQPAREAWPNVFATFKGSVVAEAEPSLARPCRRAVHRPTRTRRESTSLVGAYKSR